MDTENKKIFLNSEVEKALVSYLEAKNLDWKTKDKYLFFFHKMQNVYAELNQENLDLFLKYNNNSPARAMTKHLLKAIKRWSFPQEIVGSVAMLDIPERTGKKEKKQQLYMTLKELDYLIGNMKGDSLLDERNRLAILTQWWGGLRMSELLGLGLNDLQIDKYDKDKPFQIIKIKSESAKFKKEGRAWIKTDIYERITQNIAKRMKISQNFNRKIEAGENIWGFGKTAYGKLLRNKTRKILGRAFNTHSLRHGRANYLIQQGVGIDKVKEILRHKDISSTQTYIHTTEEDIEKVLV